MGQYEGTASQIAKQVAQAKAEKLEKESATKAVGDEMVGDLGELARDLTVVFNREHADMGAQFHATRWKEEKGTLTGSLIIRKGSKQSEVTAAVPIGDGLVTVNGSSVHRGSSPMERIENEVIRILRNALTERS